MPRNGEGVLARMVMMAMVAGAGVLGGMLAGCGSGAAGGAATAGQEAGDGAGRAMDVASLRGVGLNEPPMAGAVGMEVRSWSVRPTAEVIERAIEVAGLEPADVGSESLVAWDRLGVRVMQVRVDRLATFHAAMSGGLGVDGAVRPGERGLSIERQWIGQGVRWAEAVRGRSVRAGAVVTLDQSRLVVDGGQVRLLARCWVTPADEGAGAGVGTGAAGALLAVELLPQLQDVSGRGGDLLLPTQGTTRAEAQGLRFDRLLLRSRLSAGRALVLLPKVAAISQPGPAEPSRRAPRAGEMATLDAPAAADEAKGGGVEEAMGETEDAPTLGQLLLGGTSAAGMRGGEDEASAEDGAEGRRRIAVRRLDPAAAVIVVVVPSVPERFRLLP